MMWTGAALICQTLFIVSEAWEVSPDCWLGNEEFSVDLLCPHYTGTGEIFCCGDQHTRYKHVTVEECFKTNSSDSVVLKRIMIERRKQPWVTKKS